MYIHEARFFRIAVVTFIDNHSLLTSPTSENQPSSFTHILPFYAGSILGRVLLTVSLEELTAFFPHHGFSSGGQAHNS